MYSSNVSPLSEEPQEQSWQFWTLSNLMDTTSLENYANRYLGLQFSADQPSRFLEVLEPWEPFGLDTVLNRDSDDEIGALEHASYTDPPSCVAIKKLATRSDLEYRKERTALSRLRPGSVSRIERERANPLASICALGICAACASVMKNYERHSLRHHLKDLHNGEWTSEAIQKMNPYVPGFIEEPDPLLFAASTVAYGLATLGNVVLHHEDKHQAWFLAGGILAAVPGMLYTQSIREGLLGILPWTLIASLWMSAVTHRLMRRHRRVAEPISYSASPLEKVSISVS